MNCIFMRPELFIQTPRLILRSWTLEDRELMKILPTDPGINTFCAPGQYAYRDEADLDVKLAERLSLYQQDGLGKFIIELQGSREFVGLCGVGPYQWDGQKINELGYRLRRSYWGQGYATEVAQAVLSYVFREMKLPEVHAFADPKNSASLNIINKLGFTFQGKLLYDGIPHHVFQLIRKDWNF
ncbi:MAG: GNAT family N-acetyltransferase [Bdellovibrio sp.]|nr:GNAT family N-acetyltransferase [Bdellovibrio sp.]